MDTVLTRKIMLSVVGDDKEKDRVYSYLRNGQYVNALMRNQYISALYAANINGASREEIKEINRLYSRIPDSGKGSAYSFDMALYPTGLPLAGKIPHDVSARFSKACKDGLLHGRVSLPTYKADGPMPIPKYLVSRRGTVHRTGKNASGFIDAGFYHEYESDTQFFSELKSRRIPDVYIKFTNGITFKIKFGNKNRSAQERALISDVFMGRFPVCDSSIGVDGKDIVLNLSMKIPECKNKLDRDTVVGVDIGVAIPAVCALNNSDKEREYIGTYEEFTGYRNKMAARKRVLYKNLAQCRGGHGRSKKLAKLEKNSKRESDYAKTYNHRISKVVVDFALKHGAGVIQLEKLSGIGNKKRMSFNDTEEQKDERRLLGNWSYYQLQQMIEYKAAKQGIEIRYINPAYTSQTCSCCGQLGERVSQSVFVCSNPSCKKHGLEVNADFNAARNIAMSTDYVTDVKKEKKEKKTA